MKQWIEDHPYLTGSMVLGGLLLYFLLSRSGGSTQTVYSGGPSEALQQTQLAAGVQVQTANLAAQTQVAQFNANLAALQFQTSAAQEVQDRQTAAALALGLAQLGANGTTPATGGTPIITTPPPATGGGTLVSQTSTAAALTAAAVSQQAMINQANNSGEIRAATVGTPAQGYIPAGSYDTVDAGASSDLGVSSTAFKLPSASGFATYFDYWRAVNAQDPGVWDQSNPYAFGGIAQSNALTFAAEQEWIDDPTSGAHVDYSHSA